MAKKVYKNVRLNPVTGALDYFYPMEVKDPADKEYARVYGLEIGLARLGFRKFEAIFVPCKDKVYDPQSGMDIYVDTPSDVQRNRYLSLIRDELNWQEDVKQDGRCPISNGHGGTKRCPCRAPNPDYVPGGDKPKTLPVKCEGCKYEQFRHVHTVIELSSLDYENDNGDMETYEVPAPKSCYAGDRYLELRKEFVAFVKERNPKLAPLVELLTDEFTKSEAAQKLGDATSTVGGRTGRLKDLVTEFLDNVITL